MSNEEDDKTQRVRALEDMVRLGQMSQSDFQKLRDEIIGGDIHDVHLVKGLDYSLLERVKRGEDVLADHKENTDAQPAQSSRLSENEMEAELGELEGKAVIPLSKQENIKQGQLAPMASIRKGTKRSRNDILNDLKAARSAAKSAPHPQQPVLGTKFKKVGTMKEHSRIEIDDRGREVLLMIDADGVTKKKIRKLDPVSTSESRESLPMPRQDVAPLGSELVLPETQEPSLEEGEDIFEGVGADFNPLGDLDGSDEDVDIQDDDSASDRGAADPKGEKLEPDEKAPIVSRLVSHPADREVQNYFNEPSPPQQVEARHDYLRDPAILAALKKASSIQPLASERQTDEAEATKLARHKRLLESQDRDADDLDMGFDLSNRFDDDEDTGASKAPRLSIWDHEDDRGSKDQRRERKEEQTKRGPQQKKKRRKNVDDAAAVLEVLGQKGP